MAILRPLIAMLAAVLVVAAGAPSEAARNGRTAAARLYLSPSGSDANPCTKRSPCRTFNRAYHRAHPGQVVVLAGGVYPADQQLTADESKRSPRHVVFLPAPRAKARIARTSYYASLDIRGASHITFRGLHFEGDVGLTPAREGRLRQTSDIRIVGGTLKTFHILSARDVTIRGVEIGNYSYAEGANSSAITVDGPDAPPARNIVIDRVHWRNIRRGGSPTHPECLIVYAVDGLAIRNSKFVACPVMAMFFRGDNGRVGTNILIENNFISCGGGRWREECGSAINFRPDSPLRNVTVRFNSISGLLYLQEGGYSNFRVYGNAAGSMVCMPGVMYAYNVSDFRTCSKTDRRASPRWVKESTTDLRLRAGSPAINFVPTALCAQQSCPRADIRGRRRCGRLDAGAHELRTACRARR